MLLTTYLKILMLIIFSPLILLMEAIPGQETFASWFKGLFAELMTFPLITILFLVGNRLVDAILAGSPTLNPLANVDGQTFWTPPFLYGLNQEAFAFIVGMGIIFLIPELVAHFKKMLGVEELPFKVGLNTFFAGATTAVGGASSLAGRFRTIGGALFGENIGFKGVAEKVGIDVPNFLGGRGGKDKK